MKKACLIMMAVFAFSHVVMAASLPTIGIENVNPQPVEPGRDITVDAVFSNSLATQTGDFSVSVDVPYPLVFKSATSDMTRVNLCGNCKDRNVFFLTVDARAVSGVYPIYVIASSSGNEVKERVDIKVVGRPNLIISTDSIGLNSITPGSQFAVTMDIMNIGTGQARQIEVQPATSSFIVLGGLVKTEDFIGVNETKSITLDFVANSKLEANSYTIPLSLSYLDDQGNRINSTQSIGVKVVNKGEISIQSIKIASDAGGSDVMAGQSFSIVVRVENVGTGDADFITAFAKCPFSDEQKSFIGQLKEDEDAPAVFSMTPTGEGKYSCELRITFQDDTGAHELSDSFQVDAISSGSLANVVLILIVLAIAVFVLRNKIPFLRKKK